MSSETLKGFEPVAWMFDQPKLNIYNWTTTLAAEYERGENIRRLYTADQLAQVVQQRDELLAAAQAVIDRWDTPLWKNVPGTAEFINELRAAVENATPCVCVVPGVKVKS